MVEPKDAKDWLELASYIVVTGEGLIKLGKWLIKQADKLRKPHKHERR